MRNAHTSYVIINEVMNSLSRLKRVFSSPHFIPLLLVFFFAWLATRSLFGSGYFNMHDDLQMMRQLDMEKCLLDLQIPCRWIPDMGYGFGYPLFNFYPPLPYLVGEIFRVIGYSFVDTAKALFITSFFASGVTMYFFARKFFGRLGGVLSAIFYIWAPYHAVDSYVRGAMNESWALIWFPLILLFSFNVLSKKISKIKPLEVLYFSLPLAVSWAALLTSHNLMVIVFTPFFAVWCLMWLLYFKNWKTIFILIASGAFSLGLAAFFTLPVFVERNLVQTDSLIKGYYEYTAHFPSLGQLLFSRFWGYGPSVWALKDEMSFQIGWLHWITPLFVAIFFGLGFLRKKKLSPLMLAVGCLFLAGWAATFMAHPRSTPIWSHFQALQFIQFPWRYLTIIIFTFSFVVGSLMYILPRVIRHLVFIFLVLGAVIYSWSYFLPQHGKLGPLTDDQKFSAAAWELQQTAGIYDYLPKQAVTAPKAPKTVTAEVMEGKGDITSQKNGTNWLSFNANLLEDSVIRIDQLYFETWVVKDNGSVIDTFIPETEQWGRFYVKLGKGEHHIEARLKDTPVRVVGNIITIGTWVALLVVMLRFRSSNKSN